LFQEFFVKFADFYSVSKLERLALKNLQSNGTIFANFSKGMNFSDIIIVYLTLGSPFGVYYYLQNRSVLMAFVVALLWIPFSIKLLQSKITKALTINEFDVKFNSVSDVKKNLEQLLHENDTQLSIFEIREVLERYIGLTISANQKTDEIGNNETEIFRIADFANVKLGGICLHRKNQSKLLYHQTLAKKDFLKLISNLENQSLQNRAFDSAKNLAKFLDDSDTQKNIEKLQKLSQKFDVESVQNTEKDVWKPKPQITNQQVFQNSTNFKTMTVKK
jgi:hypothetical protein